MVFNFCTRANTEEYNPPRAGRRSANPGGGGAEFIGSDLYERLKEFLAVFAKVLLEVGSGSTGALMPFRMTHFCV